MSTATLAEPGQSASTNTASLQVIKRNGALVGFDASKISVAVTKHFLPSKAMKRQARPVSTIPWNRLPIRSCRPSADA